MTEERKSKSAEGSFADSICVERMLNGILVAASHETGFSSMKRLRKGKTMRLASNCASCAKKSVVMSLLGLSAVSVTAATSYSTNDGILTITVPAGETNSVDAAQLADANANSVTNIVKTGSGAILMDDATAIPSYTGAIHIEQGMWIIACTNALGKLSSLFDCSDVGPVSVTDGGSLAAGGSDRKICNTGRKLYISGSGVNGEGVLTLVSSTSGGDYDAGVFGRNIELVGDAVLGHSSSYNVYFTQQNTRIRLNGYKLSISYYNTSRRGYVIGGTSRSDVFAPGEIELSGRAVLTFFANTHMTGNVGRITFNDFSKFGSNGMRGRYEWPMVWNSDGEITVISQTTGNVVTNRNTWHGPVELKRTMKVNITKSGTYGLYGPVSGSGGLDLYWAQSNKPGFPTNFINFANAGSSFTGGVSVNDLVVNMMARDAVPANGGTFALTNSTVNFHTNLNYALPDGIIHVEGGSERALNRGSGSFRTLVKSGAGTLDHDSAVGAETLDLREGVVKVSAQMAPFAGLIEGVEYFKTGGESYYAARDSVFTNNVVLAPNDVYTSGGSYWTHERPDWDTDDKTLHSSATVYSGYMWNREATNVNWTFCCRVGTVSFFRFGAGQNLIINDGTSTNAVLVTVNDVAPGAHKFHFGSYAPLGNGGATSSATNFEWPYLGFRWDPLGRGSSDTNNFIKLEDPGDGSLFTWAIPGEDVFYPGTDESNRIGHLPRFDKVLFSGGTLDLNGNALSVGEAEGIPAVIGSAGFTIETKWTVDAADIAAGKKLSGQKIGFGEDAELVVENLLGARSVAVREWTVLESPEDITGSISVKDDDIAGRWSVTVEGKTVKLKYRPVGTVMTLR